MDVRLEKWSWAFVLLGAAGIIVTSTCYALSPEALALPVPLARIPEALALATEGQGRLLAFGGAVGVAADLVLTGAALVLVRTTKGLAPLGWALAAMSGLIFTFADGLAARGLQPGAAFPLAKAFFDLCFIAGTFAFGVGTLLVFWDERKGLLAKALLGAGALGTLASLATLAGADVGPANGIAIGLGVTLYALHAALRLWRPAAPEHRAPQPA
ncbi:MAG: hypothetical protein JNK82_16205 [Myxococcaceae bacterium]|nr:hypothetical protein [Myxococcaceae bacterium]